MAKASEGGIPNPEMQRIFERLGVTPEQLFHNHFGVAAGVRSTTDQLQQGAHHVGRPSIFANFWRIDLGVLHQKLLARFEDLNRRYDVGYSYMIRQNGVVVHAHTGDWAQRPGDSEPPSGDPDPRPGDIRWRQSVTMNVGSVSKFVTAIAVARLLWDKGMSATEPVAPFLPGYWARGANVDRITFDNLLRHEAGLGQSLASVTPPSGPGDFATAKSQIAQGTAGPGSKDYKNFNYAILRVLFATLTGTLPASFSFYLPPPPFGGSGSNDSANDDLWDAISAQAYANYVNEFVFAPAAIASRGFAADADSALGYETRPALPGARLVSGPGGSGSSGWHLGTGEVARLLDSFRSGAMMPKWRAQQVIDNFYGLDWGRGTRAGTFYSKGGEQVDGSGKKGIHSAIFLMPGNANLAIFCNSLGRPPARVPPAGSAGAGTVQPRRSHLDGIEDMIVDSIRFKFF